VSDDRFIYPELDFSAEEEVFGTLVGRSVEQLREDSVSNDPRSTYFPIGTRIPESHLEDFRQEVRAFVDELGWPEPYETEERLLFRTKLPTILHQKMAISAANAGRAGVWSFLSLVLMPDVAIWRWPDLTPQRVKGHAERSRNRHLFRVAWWRAEVLGESSADLLAELSEDNLVQILERPGLFRDHRLATATGDAFVDYRSEIPGGVSHEDVFRDLCKRLNRLGAFVLFEVLKAEELTEVISSELRASVKAIRTV
jgi:hypothetical protein